MRKLILLMAVAGLTVLYACEEDGPKVTIDEKEAVAPVMTGPVEGFSTAVTADNLAENLTFSWDSADYGMVVNIDYEVEMDLAGGDFTSAISLGSTTETSVSVTYGSLNETLLTTMGQAANEAVSLEVRVVASAAGKDNLVSDTLALTVTTYVEEEEEITPPDMLWLPGGYQGWDPANAPSIAAVNDTLYEGYAYISAETDLKFTSHPDYDHTNYGMAGEGILSTDNEAGSLTVGPGYFRFIVDIKNLTYQVDLIESWGLIGTATDGDWDNSIPMEFDEETGTWSATADLTAEALKFRANNAWDINLGPEDSNVLEGKLIKTDASVTIPEAGSYTVVINLNNGESPYAYTYSVTKN